MRQYASILAMVLIMMPLGARSADLVVWWEEGFYPQEDDAIAEIVAVFEQDTGRKVELLLLPQDEILSKAEAALEAGQPPDFLWSTTTEGWFARWAYEDRLADLGGALDPVLDLFDADAIEAGTLLNGRTGEHGLYGLPMGRWSNHVHVWNSLLEDAGFTPADIPQEWDAFWSFWCDEVQPAVRRALGRDDIWAIGLPMSVQATLDTQDQLFQFQLAYAAPWVDRDGVLQVDDAAVRDGLVKPMTSYTMSWRKGCTPPDSVRWGNFDNNKKFLGQKVVMTPNTTLSIPGELRTARPDDYYQNVATIDWPNDARGQPLIISGGYCSPWSSRPAATPRSPTGSCASWPKTAGSPTG